jgi:hypothetical protein
MEYIHSPLLTTTPLMTNQSYNQNFLKKISIETAIKLSLKLHFEQHFKLYTQSVDCHNARHWDNSKTTYLNGTQSARGGTFHLISYFQLMTNLTYN